MESINQTEISNSHPRDGRRDTFDETTRDTLAILGFVVAGGTCLFCLLLLIAAFQYISMALLCMMKLRKCD